MTVLLIVGGCDQQSSRQVQGRKQFEQVLDALREVELGYVSATPEEIAASNAGREVNSTRQSMETFRQQQLGKTFELLDPILKDGTVKQQVDARRLAADIYTSSARFQMRQMMDEWTSLSSRSIVMMSYMVAVGRSESLASNMQYDDNKLIAQIKKTLRDTTVDLEKREKEAKQIDEKAKDLKKTMGDLQKQIDALNIQSQQTKSKAFVAKVNEKYKLLDDASSVSRQAAILDARRQVEQAQLENVNAQRAMLTEQIDFTLEFMDSLERQIETASQRQKQSEAQKARAKQGLIDDENKFMDEFNVVVESFTKQVLPYFTQINADMTQAIDMLKKAKAQASGDEAQLIEIELLAKEVSAVNMQTTMMMVMQDLGHKYQAILGRATKGKQKLMADRKATFQSAYEQMQREQMTISQQAQTLLSESQQQATTTMNLVSAEGSITRMAKAAKSQDIDKLTATTSDLNDLLSKYAKRINEYKLN
jgi:hypothetical protein